MNDNIICYTTYNDLTNAYLAKNILEENGISSFIENEHITTANPFLTNAVGGIRLMINENNAEHVGQLLNETISEETNETSQENEIATDVRCPKCNSINTRQEDVSAAAFVISIFTLGFPIPFLKRKHHCFDCGHEWK